MTNRARCNTRSSGETIQPDSRSLTIVPTDLYGRFGRMRCYRYKGRALSDWVALAAVAFSIMLFSTASIASDAIGTGARRLSGAIKDSLGGPIAGAEVRLEDGGRVLVRTHTDA